MEQQADPNRTHQLERLFAMCTGIVRGTVDHIAALLSWLKPITAASVPVIAKTYMQYPNVLYSLLKFLFHAGRHYLSSAAPHETAREYFYTIQLVTEAFAQCHGQNLSADVCDDDSTSGPADDGSAEELLANVTLVFR